MYLHHPRRVTHRSPRPLRRPRRLLGGCLLAALAAAACSDSGGSNSAEQPSTDAAPASDPPTQPTAADSQRVDLVEPTFSVPITVDNPLFPISDLHSAILLGNDEGNPLRIETVLLPEPKVVDVGGEKVETLVSQFVSYLDGRIHEVALDWYAQDDAGNVWYFGEDVFNYEDGVVADTEGTWIAGEDGPPGMIMPADPEVGQAYRPENIPDLVFEEVTVKTLDLTVDGPRGPVTGAMVGTENHLLEGNYEDKTFAPGYGEFTSGVGANLEALALAVPTDAQPGGVPPELEAISQGATEVFSAADSGDWEAATQSLDTMTARVGGPPGHRHRAPAAGRADGPGSRRIARQRVDAGGRRPQPGGCPQRRARRRDGGPRPGTAVPAADRGRPRSVRRLGQPARDRQRQRRGRPRTGRRRRELARSGSGTASPTASARPMWTRSRAS